MAGERQCVAELNVANTDKVMTAKRQLALGAQNLLKSAECTHANTVCALNIIRET
jgi:hypothetical protein